MPKFFYPIHVPSLDKAYYFNEFTCDQYKPLLKTMINGDNNAFDIFVDELLDELCKDKLDISTLTNFDKFIILLEIRMTSIAPTITLNIPLENEKEQGNMVIELSDVVATARSYNVSHKFKIKDGNMTVEGTLPSKFYFNDWYGVGVDCISSITLNDRHIDMVNMDLHSKNKIVGSLPAPIMSHVINFFKTQSEKCLSKPLVQVPIPESPGELQDVYISPVNDALPEVIKMIYNYNLKDIYAGQLALMYQFKLQHTFIEKSTPAEISLYFNIISEEMDRREAESKKDGDSSNPMPPPPQGIQ